MNTFYIGMARSGSTWLHQQVESHPQMYGSAAKDLYFFDKQYGRGTGWYEKFFAEANHRSKVPIDISHDYFQNCIVPTRIAQYAPNARLLLCLREPMAWIDSVCQSFRRNGKERRSSGEIVAQNQNIAPTALLDAYLAHWLRWFDLDQMLIYTFDDLRADPAALWTRICQFLEVEVVVPTGIRETVNASAQARSPLIAGVTKRLAERARSTGHPVMVGQLKHNFVVRKLLYTEPSSDKSLSLTVEEKAILQRFYRPSVERLSTLSGLDLVSTWKYDVPDPVRTL